MNKEVLEFLNQEEGVRVIQLVVRNKDQSEDVDSKNGLVRAYIVQNEDLEEKYMKLIDEGNRLFSEKGIKGRIYISTNRRNMQKSIRAFKHKVIEADYHNTKAYYKDVFHFYMNLNSSFISSLSKNSNKDESYFLIDIDVKDKEIVQDVENFCEARAIRIFLKLPTPNGFHYITSPFNPALMTEALPAGVHGKTTKEDVKVSIHQDGMLLLNYFENI